MIEHTVGELLADKVELDVEGIDRIYLNAYQPRLQTGGGVVGFFREHRGAVVASTSLMGPMSKAFVADIHRYAKREGIEIVHFERGQRKDEETQRRLKQFQAEEGVLYIGVAQEKFAGFRVIKKISAYTGTAFPWLARGMAGGLHPGQEAPAQTGTDDEHPHPAHRRSRRFSRAQVRRRARHANALAGAAARAGLRRGDAICSRSKGHLAELCAKR